MSVGAPRKVKLDIPQVTLAQLAQSGKHLSGSQRDPGSIQTSSDNGLDNKQQTIILHFNCIGVFYLQVLIDIISTVLYCVKHYKQCS